MKESLKERFIFRLRHFTIRSRIRTAYWRILGMEVGMGTILPRIHVTWPHQVGIGKNCRIERDVYFHFDGVFKPGPTIRIGNNCFVGTGCEFNIRKGIIIGDGSLIAAGSRFIDHDHGLDPQGGFIDNPDLERMIFIGQRVWIGANVLLLKGVQIGDSAVVGAGSVVTKDVPPRTIVAGSPARRIGARAPQEQ